MAQAQAVVGDSAMVAVGQVGKKIVNPYASMEAVFADHSREAAGRMKNSKHRERRRGEQEKRVRHPPHYHLYPLGPKPRCPGSSFIHFGRHICFLRGNIMKIVCPS